MNNNLILVCSLMLKRVARFDILSSIEIHVVEKRLEQINKTFSFLNWIIPFKFGFKGVCLQTLNCSNLFFFWHIVEVMDESSVWPHLPLLSLVNSRLSSTHTLCWHISTNPSPQGSNMTNLSTLWRLKHTQDLKKSTRFPLYITIHSRFRSQLMPIIVGIDNDVIY